MWHFSLYSLVLIFDDSVIFLLPFTQRGAMAISIPMVPYASNKGNREKKKALRTDPALAAIGSMDGLAGDQICQWNSVAPDLPLTFLYLFHHLWALSS